MDEKDVELGPQEPDEAEVQTDPQVANSNGGHPRLKKSESAFSGMGSFEQSEEKKAYGWRETLLLAYQTLGVVYGDLGTSPLYVFPTIQINSRDERDYLGILSIIFWTLTLVGLVKYVAIVLSADDHGEGGTFAVYSLLCQHANVGKHLGRQYERLESDTTLSYFTPSQPEPRAKKFLEKSQGSQTFLLIIVMVGTCMVIGDGVLTPAISVLSATGGIKSAVPAISQSVVIVISCAILLGLFLIQRFGTSKVSFMFSPIMLAWFITTAMIGLYNIVVNYPAVFKALSPHYVIIFFARNKEKGWSMLGGIVLCITGAEAMFADLGHFSKSAIQIAFTTVVYPSLVLTYAGETAYLIKHPGDRDDAFFKSIPHVVYWPMFVISTLAAIVASQALITATFSVLKQSMSLGCFPRIKLVYTSPNKEGQVYSPEVNYIIMILCLAVVVGFRNGTDIGNAFGVAVVWVMLITTFLVSVVMLVVWRINLVWIVLFLLVFGSIETVYMTAVLNKIVQGGWVPFAISLVFFTVSWSWNKGRRTKYEFEARNRLTSSDLAEMVTSMDVRRVPGMCLFYSNLVHGVPPIMLHYIKATGSLHEVVIFLTIRVAPVKTVLPAERFYVARGGGVKGFYRCVVRYGYLDTIDMKGGKFVDDLVKVLVDSIMVGEPSGENAIKRQFELETLDAAHKKGPVHVIGHSILEASKKTNWFQKLLVNQLYWLLHNICRSVEATFHIPSEQLLQVAMVYET